MRAASAVVLALWLVALFSQPALAEKRVALVIGNSAYKNVARLNNPVNDAATNNTQEPFVYGSLGGNDVTLVPAAPAAAAASVDQDATMRRDYELALQIGTKPVWDSSHHWRHAARQISRRKPA